jgi:UDPglucose 6-dehydrogenase
MGALVKAYDPISNDSCKSLHPELEIVYCENLEQLARGCDALLLATEWREFKEADWQSLGKLMKNPLVIDGRNALSEKDMAKSGVVYKGVGH